MNLPRVLSHPLLSVGVPSGLIFASKVSCIGMNFNTPKWFCQRSKLYKHCFLCPGNDADIAPASFRNSRKRFPRSVSLNSFIPLGPLPTAMSDPGAVSPAGVSKIDKKMLALFFSLCYTMPCVRKTPSHTSGRKSRGSFPGWFRDPYMGHWHSW